MNPNLSFSKPELLCPAGNLEKLKIACLYGADAVYLGGMDFNLRAASENFTEHEMGKAVKFARQHKVKVYVVLNNFMHDDDIDALISYLRFLEKVKVDAVLVSDVGAIKVIKENSNLEIHLSTQQSCVNTESAKIWKALGVNRIVFGREISISEASKIRDEVGIEVELFIHGSMCMAWSGNCVISNYTEGRDSNRGGCAQSCRFEYDVTLSDGQKFKDVNVLSSKDLNGIELLPKFFESKIDSIKIEGRMKSLLYLATLTKSYRQAIDKFHHYKVSSFLMEKKETLKIIHRPYTQASLLEKASHNSIAIKENESVSLGEFVYIGMILYTEEASKILIQVKNPFKLGDDIEIIPFKGETIKVRVEGLFNIRGEPIEKTRPNSLAFCPSDFHEIKPYQIVRMLSNA